MLSASPRPVGRFSPLLLRLAPRISFPAYLVPPPFHFPTLTAGPLNLSFPSPTPNLKKACPLYRWLSSAVPVRAFPGSSRCCRGWPSPLAGHRSRSIFDLLNSFRAARSHLHAHLLLALWLDMFPPFDFFCLCPFFFISNSPYLKNSLPLCFNLACVL